MYRRAFAQQGGDGRAEKLISAASKLSVIKSARFSRTESIPDVFSPPIDPRAPPAFNGKLPTPILEKIAGAFQLFSICRTKVNDGNEQQSSMSQQQQQQQHGIEYPNEYRKSVFFIIN